MRFKKYETTIDKNLDTRRKIDSLKNMYFNRYLMIRYFLASLFFANFYWLCFTFMSPLSVIALLLLLLAIPSAAEMFLLLGKKKPEVKWTNTFFKVQAGVCLVMVFCVLTFPIYKVLPFFIESPISHLLGVGLFSIGFLMSLTVLTRMRKISKNQDKQYQRIKYYEKVLRINIFKEKY